MVSIIAESLGKSRTITHYFKNMPKNNHSLILLYLEGLKIIFLLFYVYEKINNNKNTFSKEYLKVKIYQIYLCPKKQLEIKKIFHLF